jgi:hypothetical protein
VFVLRSRQLAFHPPGFAAVIHNNANGPPRVQAGSRICWHSRFPDDIALIFVRIPIDIEILPETLPAFAPLPPLATKPPNVATVWRTVVTGIKKVPSSSWDKGWPVWGSNLVGGKISRTHPSAALGPTQPPIQCTTESFPELKRPGCGVDHPPHLAPRLKKKYTSTPPLGLRGLFYDELYLYLYRVRTGYTDISFLSPVQISNVSILAYFYRIHHLTMVL